MSETLHDKLLTFLSGEFARKGGQQCVRVDLLYSQPQCREEELCRWVREQDPELFENLSRLEKLIGDIIEKAEAHTDTFGQGRHRYVVRTHQHLHGRMTQAFVMSPAAGLDGALVPAGQPASSGPVELLSQNNQALMRGWQSMFQNSFGTLANITEGLRSDNAKLVTENIELRRKLEEAESTRLEREYSIFERTEQAKQRSQGFNALMQVGTVVAAKLTGGSGPVGPAPLVMLLGKFGDSLRRDQVDRLMTILDGMQKMMFMEIMNLVAQEAQEAQAAQAQAEQQMPPNGAGTTPPPNGAPHP